MLDVLQFKNNGIRQNARELIPDGNLTTCLTSGACSNDSSATGIMDIYQKKFINIE